MTQLRIFSWTLISMTALALSCAQVTGGDADSGDGDGDRPTGGATGSGGTTFSMSGGSTGAGGSGPLGTGGLTGTGGTVTVSCMEEETLACADVPGNTTLLFGEAVCNETGDGWDLTTCMVCEAGVGMIDCAEIVGGAATYTGGTAVCNDDGDGWVEATCEFCGDDAINGVGEICDGAATPSETCAGFGLGDGTSGGAALGCTEACQIDVSTCDRCSAGFTGGKCLDSSTSCSGTACADTQCGAGNTCTMACGSNGCEGMSCAPTATCNVTSGHQGVVEIECLSQSTCQVACGGNGGSSCALTCLSGATCSNTGQNETDVSYDCEAGSICEIECGSNGGTCDVNCASGSACSVTATANAARPIGTAVCADATCSYTFGGQGVSALAIVCEDGGVCNVTVSNNDTKLSTPIECEAGSVCNINCQVMNGTDNCPYICDDDAECTCTGTKCVAL